MSERSKHLEYLRGTAREAVWSGDFDRALSLIDEGLALSRRWKLRESEEIFLCNQVATLLEMGRGDFDLSALKEVLLRHANGRVAAFAAYTAARAHHFRKENARARTYAQMSLSRCEAGDDYLRGAAIHLSATVDLSECRYDAAMKGYRDAIGVFQACEEETARELAQAEDNIGYIHICREEVDEGLRMVSRSLAQFESLGARVYQTFPCLDLCFGNLKRRDFDTAEQWGVRALALGAEFGQRDVVKNSHLLLGELYAETERESEAEEHFSALAAFYPEFPEIKGFLHQVNVVEMVNLRA